MLEVILGMDIHNVVVVVTRYFGGILLGTGGLVRAYQAAVKEGLANSVIIEKKPGFSYRIKTDYNGIGKIKYIMDSNMGYNLLGYIVEQQSGETYENYVTEHLLNPLQMTNASVRIPQGTMATGYEYNGEDYEKQPFAYQYTSGSSGIIASVTDMENYMEMQLNEGLFENTKVLNSETVIKMQKRQFANNPVFEGMGYGFVRDRINGVLVLKHEGALPGYATTMLLLPDEQIGIYVATNSLSGICFDFEEAFFDYFYSKEEMRQKINDAAEDDLESYVGTYRSYDGIAQTNLMKIGILMETSDLKISKDKSGQLKMEGYNQKKEKEEIKLADDNDMHRISLGRRILRTETAGLATLAMLVFNLDS